MSIVQSDKARKLLPRPVELSPEQVGQIAAGTAALIPVALAKPVLAGGMPIVLISGSAFFAP